MSKKSFKSATRRSEPILFDLDDEAYEFMPPKMASITLAMVDAPDDEAGEVAATRELFKWLYLGLGEGAERVKDRLRDPNDDLDQRTIVEVARWLTGVVGGNPTIESSDS